MSDNDSAALCNAVNQADNDFDDTAVDQAVMPCMSIPGPLCFTISHYNDYLNYNWSRFYTSDDYGEIGLDLDGYMGDPQSVTALQTGYVYIYKGTSLWKVFTVTNGQYQEVSVSGGNVSYGSSIGPARNHVFIEDYFESEHSIPEQIVIIDSLIRLSPNRLSGHLHSIDADPRRRGVIFQLSFSRMSDAPETPLAGSEILENYRSRGDTPDLVTYNMKKQTFDGETGFDLRRPHAFNEANRRNEVYRERLQTYQIWLNDEDRNKEAYIHQIIAATIRQDSDREDAINMPLLRRWKRNDNEEYRQHFFPLHYATEALIAWLDSSIFKEWLLDYNHSDDDDTQELSLGAFVSGIMELSLSNRGREFLEEHFDDPRSFFNMATHIPEIRREYSDPAAHSNFAVEVRKVSNVIFAGLHEFAALIVKDNGDPRQVTSRLIRWAQTKGVRIQSSQSRASRTVGTRLAHIDLDALESSAASMRNFADSTSGRSIITFFEVINLSIAIYGVSEAYRAPRGEGYNSNLIFNIINAAGATADMTAAGLLERHAARFIQRRGWQASRIYGLVVFAGIVDVIIGARGVTQEMSSGDYDAAFGWAVFTVGGVIVAVGGYLQLTGGTVAVGSGGTGSVPGGALILLGFVVEAIGLLWVWLANDDEFDEWLKQSRFGTNIQSNSLDEDIRLLNEIMCKFEVEADFVSDRRVNLEITPRLFTEESVLELTNITTGARARAIEYLIGDRDDLTVGASGHGNFTIDPGGSSRGVTFEREDGRVTKITLSIWARQDIDSVRGNADLNIGPGGYIHGYTTRFNVQKGFFE
ncbi:hypothetical protein PN836_005865 [Ningiella sp. W23]|uniref:hypothetical protein n=1 Tax=Ningiella sp. W23 TaxID=3023715 RepID=UPI0037564139